MKKKLKLIINILLIFIIVILLGYCLLRIFNKIEIYSVETGSMENDIHIGDYIMILKKNNYEVGDVITYKKDGYFITHRIIKKDNETIITKGDANNLEDEAINIKNIEGKVIIAGGILNIVIKYKYFLAAICLSLYLVSCSFNEEKRKDVMV